MAAHIGSNDVAISLLDRAGAKLERRWDGSFAVDSKIAAQVLQENKREQVEWSQLHAEYGAYLNRREHDRALAWQQAYREANAAAFAAQIRYAERLSEQGTDPTGEYGGGWAANGGFPIGRNPDPAVESKARQVAKEAREKWEKRNPELSFEEWNKKGRH